MTDEGAFQRGHREGGVDALLKEHGLHLASLNGSMERVAVELNTTAQDNARANEQLLAAIGQLEAKFDAAISRLEAQRTADVATVETTARALESERKVRSDQSSAAWTPMQRFLAVVVAIGGLIGVATTVYLATRHP